MQKRISRGLYDLGNGFTAKLKPNGRYAIMQDDVPIHEEHTVDDAETYINHLLNIQTQPPVKVKRVAPKNTAIPSMPNTVLNIAAGSQWATLSTDKKNNISVNIHHSDDKVNSTVVIRDGYIKVQMSKLGQHTEDQADKFLEDELLKAMERLAKIIEKRKAFALLQAKNGFQQPAPPPSKSRSKNANSEHPNANYWPADDDDDGSAPAVTSTSNYDPFGDDDDDDLWDDD